MNGIQGVSGQRSLQSQTAKPQKAVKGPDLGRSRDCYTPSGRIDSNPGIHSDHDAQGAIDRLTAQLKKEESFVNSKRRNFLNNPIGRELATAIILADPELQEQIAKNMWQDTAQSNAMRMTNPDHYGAPLYLPPDYHGYDIKEMLQAEVKPENRNQQEVSQVLIKYYNILNGKAKTSGLTDTERLLSASIEQTEKAAQKTFDEKMEPIRTSLEKEVFAQNKVYSFSLDTSTFAFSVSGGTAEDNAKMEQAINTRHDKLLTTLTALCTDKSVSESVAKKLESVLLSYQQQYEQKHMEKYLNKQQVRMPIPELKNVVFTFENGVFKIADD